MPPTSSAQWRRDLSAGLLARRKEIEEALLARVYAVADPGEVSDPEYMEGLRVAATGALDYALLAVGRSEEGAPPLPAAVLSQARLAARHRVSLDTVLRRYLAGYTLFRNFLVEEAEKGGSWSNAALTRLLRAQASLFDRLIAAVTSEYRCESEERLVSSEQQLARRIERLLDGDLFDTASLAYDFTGYHLGGVATGPDTAEASRSLAASLDRHLLLVRRGEGVLWLWLGGRRPFDPAGLDSHLSSLWPTRACLALGEPGQGLTGWRLTHRQAEAALPVALREEPRVVRYRDVAFLASIAHDDLLAVSLRKLYLSPLSQDPDGGATSRETLRAYFASGQNTSSAAAALGINRNTLASRLRAIEQAIDRPISSCASDLEIALRIESFTELSALPAAGQPAESSGSR